MEQSPLVVGDVVLTPIAEVVLEERRVGKRVLYFGRKRPIAVRVRTPRRSFRIELPPLDEP